jgi:hypothetical protein
VFTFCRNTDSNVQKTFYPQPPQGGFIKLQNINKSPLGDLGVGLGKETFMTRSLGTDYQIKQNDNKNALIKVINKNVKKWGKVE